MRTSQGFGARNCPLYWFCGRKIASRKEGTSTENVTTPKNMASPKKKATAKSAAKFKDLKSKKDPKGGALPVDGRSKPLSPIDG